MVSWSPRVIPAYLSQENPRKRSLFLITLHQEHYTIYIIALTSSTIHQKTNYELRLIKDSILRTSKLYENCYTCSIIQKQPRASIPNKTKARVPHPHRYFHADVIKREGQNILLIIDHFMSMVSSAIIASEKASDLKAGIINLTTSLSHLGPITIITD